MSEAASDIIARSDKSADFVELFFDLVFVFAITRVTALLHHDLTWSGAGHALLIFWLIWWAWTQFTWVLTGANTRHTTVRLVTLAATGTAFFMAEAVPDAYAGGGLAFAGAYVATRLLGLSLFLHLATGEGNRAAIVLFATLSLSGLAAAIAGALLTSPWRELLWTLVVVLDYLAALRAGGGEWTIHPSHFSERHGLIVIVALGESLIAAGLGLEGLERDAGFVLLTSAAVLLVCALWWIYFGGPKEELEHLLARQPPEQRGRVARDVFSFGHIPIVGGVILLAVAIEEAVAHPGDPLPLAGAAALAGGAVLYLAGITYGLWSAHRCAVGPWLLAGAAVVGAVAATRGTPAAASLVAVALVLVAAAVVDRRALARARYGAAPAARRPLA